MSKFWKSQGFWLCTISWIHPAQLSYILPTFSDTTSRQKVGTLPTHTLLCLAHLQFCIRVVILEIALPTAEREGYHTTTGITPTDGFRKLRDKWLSDGEESPFNRIHRMLVYGLAAARNTPGRERVRWSEDGRTLYFDGQPLMVSEWQGMITGLIKDFEATLKELLFLPSDSAIPDIDLTKVHDNPGNQDVGHYFAHNEPTAIRDARARLLKRLDSQGQLKGWIRVGEDGIASYNPVKRAKYELLVNRFLELAWLLINFTCGVTGRGTEVLSIRYMNAMATVRNIMVEDGQMMFATSMHKSVHITDDLKVYILDLHLT